MVSTRASPQALTDDQATPFFSTITTLLTPTGPLALRRHLNAKLNFERWHEDKKELVDVFNGWPYVTDYDRTAVFPANMRQIDKFPKVWITEQVSDVIQWEVLEERTAVRLSKGGFGCCEVGYGTEMDDFGYF